MQTVAFNLGMTADLREEKNSELTPVVDKGKEEHCQTIPAEDTLNDRISYNEIWVTRQMREMFLSCVVLSSLQTFRKGGRVK